MLLDRHQVEIVADIDMSLGLDRDHRVILHDLVADDRLIQPCIALLVIVFDQVLQAVPVAEHHHPLGILRILERYRQGLVPDDGLTLGDPAGDLAETVMSDLEPAVLALVDV